MGIETIISTLVGPITGLLSEFVVDKDKQAALAHEIATLATKQSHEQVLAQLKVNQVEAASNNLFVAGWRPGAGWVCVLALGVNHLLIPLINTVLAVIEHPAVIVHMDMATMMPILLGMLGLGGARSYEKSKGVARSS